jgi:hypothetical protein
MICDTGVDPNADDLAAIMTVCNLKMLSKGELSVSVGALHMHEPPLNKKTGVSPHEFRKSWPKALHISWLLPAWPSLTSFGARMLQRIHI